ncbi:hypothetical protein H5968_12600 [Sphaerospermopsis sp. LEGE 00249]|nr:hypothetical protein [Sphaerospermopsis sp. LEGE 00249]
MENNLGQKFIIYRPNADASSTLRERPYRSQEEEELISVLCTLYFALCTLH